MPNGPVSNGVVEQAGQRKERLTFANVGQQYRLHDLYPPRPMEASPRGRVGAADSGLDEAVHAFVQVPLVPKGAGTSLEKHGTHYAVASLGLLAGRRGAVERGCRLNNEHSIAALRRSGQMSRVPTPLPARTGGK